MRRVVTAPRFRHLVHVTDTRRAPVRPAAPRNLPIPTERAPSSMRIAQIAPLFEAVPPKLYGGTERVVLLAHRGAGGDGPRRDPVRLRRFSITSAKLDAPWPRALRLDPDIRDWVATYAMHDRIRAPARRPVRRAAFPHRLLAELGVPPPATCRSSPPCTAGSTCRSSRPSTACSRRCRWSRFPTASASRCPMSAGRPRSITACRKTC